MDKVKENGRIAETLTTTAPTDEAQPMPQELFDAFLKDNGLTLHVYVLAPKSGTPVPVFDYLPTGWDTLFFRATK